MCYSVILWWHVCLPYYIHHPSMCLFRNSCWCVRAVECRPHATEVRTCFPCSCVVVTSIAPMSQLPLSHVCVLSLMTPHFLATKVGSLWELWWAQLHWEDGGIQRRGVNYGIPGVHWAEDKGMQQWGSRQHSLLLGRHLHTNFGMLWPVVSESEEDNLARSNTMMLTCTTESFLQGTEWWCGRVETSLTGALAQFWSAEDQFSQACRSSPGMCVTACSQSWICICMVIQVQ